MEKIKEITDKFLHWEEIDGEVASDLPEEAAMDHNKMLRALIEIARIVRESKLGSSA